MNRIFYIHSNIVAIASYQTVKDSLDNGDRVIIITNRHLYWPFFLDKVIIYDFSRIFAGDDNKRDAIHNLRAIKGYLKYMAYLSKIYKVEKNLIADEDFIFYMPSMAIDMTSPLANNRHCKGYYYVDEGVLSYASEDILKKYKPKRFKNIIKSLFGLEDYFHYEITPKFKGTISITKEAFEWNNSYDKIVNSIDGYIAEIKAKTPLFDDVIVTSYLTEDFEIIKQSLDYAIDRIFKFYPASKLGIKMHPHVVTYYPEKAVMVQKYLEDQYDGKVGVISIDVSIEVMSLVCHPRLYSLFSLSSILLYGLLFHSSKINLIDYENGYVNIKEIHSVDEFHKIEKNVNFRKIN